MANQDAEQEVKKKPVRYGSKKPKNKAQQQSETTPAPELEAEKPDEEPGAENLEETATGTVQDALTLSLPSSKSMFSQPFMEKCMSDAMRIWLYNRFSSE